MPYLRISEAHRWGEIAAREEKRDAATILLQESAMSARMQHYDVFFSHSFKDSLAVLGIKRMIESFDLSVYVDWIDDPNLDRANVTVEAASLLRTRMNASSSLIYGHSPHSIESKWMPWELGYFDGRRPSFVWIIPLVEQYDFEFVRQEYLKLYPVIEVMEVASRLGSGTMNTLGFPGVDYISPEQPGYKVRLSEAVRGQGIYLRSK